MLEVHSRPVQPQGREHSGHTYLELVACCVVAHRSRLLPVYTADVIPTHPGISAAQSDFPHAIRYCVDACATPWNPFNAQAGGVPRRVDRGDRPPARDAQLHHHRRNPGGDAAAFLHAIASSACASTISLPLLCAYSIHRRWPCSASRPGESEHELLFIRHLRASAIRAPSARASWRRACIPAPTPTSTASRSRSRQPPLPRVHYRDHWATTCSILTFRRTQSAGDRGRIVVEQQSLPDVPRFLAPDAGALDELIASAITGRCCCPACSLWKHPRSSCWLRN